jgi:hypothetical protein
MLLTVPAMALQRKLRLAPALVSHGLAQAAAGSCRHVALPLSNLSSANP